MDRAAQASRWIRRSPLGSEAAVRLMFAASARPDTASAQGHGPSSGSRGLRVADHRLLGTSGRAPWLTRSASSRISWEPSFVALADA